MKQNTSALSVALVLLSGVLWGVIGIFSRYFTSVGVSAFSQVFLRLTAASVLLLIFLLITDPKALKFRWKDAWIFFGSGMGSIVCMQVCYMSTIEQSSLAVAAVLLYTSPVFVMLLSALFYREKITVPKSVSAVLAVIGCALASGIADGGLSVSPKVAAIGVFSGLAYASYSIFARAALNRGYSSLTLTVWSFLLALIPLSFLADFNAIGSAIKADGAKAYLMWILLGLITAALPYTLYTVGMKGMESGKAAVTVAVEPVVAVLVGVIVFRESMTVFAALGTGLVILAIILPGIVDLIRSKKN